MTTDRKINEAGWFYHAPARRQVSAEPVQVPLTSQIPGLNDLPPENSQHEMFFKDTDSKYIRMAKQGGRKDLLVINEQPKRTSEPKGYPRVDWFYLEDNAAEDTVEKKKDWEFLLPEYMVHDPTGSGDHLEGVEREKAKRAPYATNNSPLFTHDGPSLTDKTVKLPEVRPAGYGVRSSKPLHFPKQPPRERPIMPPSDTNLQGERTRRRCVPEISKERVDMHKLLSFEYNKEWHQSVNRSPPKEDKSKSGLTFLDQQESIGKLSAGNSRHRREINSKVTEDKEPFIMSKFKNVPARVDSHQKFDNHVSPKLATQTTDG